MTRAAVGCREDFSGDDEGEGVCAKVEEEVADCDEDDGGGGGRRAMDAIVDATSNDEEEGE